MKKNSLFYFNKKKKVKDLLTQMDTIEVQNQRKQLRKIITERKNKLREILTLQRSNEKPDFKYLKKDYSEFITTDPISKNQPFIHQKIKRKLAALSIRAFSSQPNLKAGAANILGKIKIQINDSTIVNGKFRQYDRIIDEQSGPKKIEKLQKLKLIGLKKSSLQNDSMKKTYFQKFASDRFNFYDSNNYSSIRSSILSKSRTDRDIKSINKTKIKAINSSTIDTSQSQEQSFVHYLKKSRIHKNLTKEYESLVNSVNRSRVKISQIKHLQPIQFQKNLNSIQY